MKSLYCCIVLLWIAIPATTQSPLPAPEHNPAPESRTWQAFTSYEGRFRIVSPGPFTEKIDSIETKIGKVTYYTFYYQPTEKNADNLFYMLSYCDYPEHTIHSDSLTLLHDFFEATLESAAESMRGHLLYSNDVQLKKFPGKIWRIDYLDGKAVIKTKAFLVRNRFYSLQTITLKERSLNSSSDKFLDSFRLLE